MIIELAKEYLSKEGFRHDMFTDNTLHFKYQGRDFFIEEDADDTSFFRIILPNIYEVEDDREKVLEAANEVSRSTKAIKAFIEDNSLWLTIEMFLDSTPEIDDFFERCLDILLSGLNDCAKMICE